MSLHEMVCNKPRPCFKYINSFNSKKNRFEKFYIGWEYSIEYVKKRTTFKE